MSNILTNNLETKSYTVFLSSVDKSSGNNNNATFQINWDDFLPRNFTTYKMSFSFQSGGGNYKDSSFTNNTNSGTSGTYTIQLTNSATTGSVVVGMSITGSSYIPTNTIINSIALSTPSAGFTTITLSKALTGSVLSVNLAGSVVYSGCKIVLDSLGKSYSFDSNSKGPSTILGYAQRDIQSASTTSNSFSAFYLQFPPKTISRPSQNFTTISLYNLNNNVLLTDTSSTGAPTTDCTNWNIILEFIPVLSSEIHL